MIEFIEHFQTVVKAQEVRSNCNSISFLNQGSATITINNNLILVPGAQYYSPGNRDEINISSYTLAQATAGTFNVCVMRKQYTKGV